MEIINMILHIIAITSIIALTTAVREMHETVKLVMYESDIPDDLTEYIED